MVNTPFQRLLLFTAFGLLAFLTTPTSTAHATPPDTFGFGSRSTSLGGAVSATVSDVAASYYNPAGLARSEALQLHVGYFSQSPFLSINGETSNVERHGAMSFGLVAPATFGSFRIAFGIALQLPDQRVARTRSAIVGRPRWELYDTRSHRLYLSTNLAIRPVEWLTLGGGLSFQSASLLTLDIRGDVPFTSVEENSRLEHQFRGDLTSVRYPTVGVQVQPHERVSVGMVYRGEVHLTSTIIATADAALAGSPLVFSLVSGATTLFAPQQVSLGIELQPLDRLSVALELTWANWSAHPSLISDQQIVLEFSGLGGDIEAVPPIPLELHDTFVPRLGIEYAALQGDIDLDLRFGYVYENSPFPAQTGIANFVDNDKHTFSLGIGLGLNNLRPTLPGSLRFAAHFALGVLESRDHIKSSFVDPVGDYSSGGLLVAAGLDATVAFQ